MGHVCIDIYILHIIYYILIMYKNIVYYVIYIYIQTGLRYVDSMRVVQGSLGCAVRS